MWASACIPNKLNIHRYSNGELLYSEQGYGQKMQEAYGSPFLDIHRADLQLALVEKAKSLGVDFRLGETIAKESFKQVRVYRTICTRVVIEERGGLIIVV